METNLLQQILLELKSINNRLNENKAVKTLGYKEIAETLQIGENKSGDFLRKYGYRVGHWAIEEGKLRRLLRNSKGDLLK